MEPDTPENRRRLDPVVALQELLDAGFVLEAWSDLHHRPDDELRYEVGRHTVTGNTDRFTFRLRKPR
jgi:predicted methyltransferase